MINSITPKVSVGISTKSPLPDFQFHFIYSDSPNYIDYKKAKKLLVKGHHVVMAIQNKTPQSTKHLVSYQVPKWAKGKLGLRFIQVVHGGIQDKEQFEGFYAKQDQIGSLAKRMQELEGKS